MADATFSLPLLTAYDPPGTSEGTLDPLGLYPIADQLPVQLVPAVRERMQLRRHARGGADRRELTFRLEGSSRSPRSSPAA
jgi:hypothetical protein